MLMYRGMSTLELEVWKESGKVPSTRNFTDNLGEAAFYAGLFLCGKGDPIVLALPLNEVRFQLTNPSTNGFVGNWYQTTAEFGLANYQVIRPQQVRDGLYVENSPTPPNV